MPSLAAYALAGAASGFGNGIVEHAKMLADEALAEQEHNDKWDMAQQQHDWRMEEIDQRGSYTKAGRGRGRSGGSGGRGLAAATGAAVPDSPEPSSSSAFVSKGGQTQADKDYPTYEERPASASSNIDDNLPRRATRHEKVVNRFKAQDGSWRAFTTDTNEPVLLSDPDPKQAVETTGTGKGSGKLTDRFAGDDGYFYGSDEGGVVRPYLDANGKQVRAPRPKGEEGDMPDPARGLLDDALKNADVSVKAQAEAEVDRLVSTGTSEPQAINDVISRLDIPEIPARDTWMPFDATPASKGPAKGLRGATGGAPAPDAQPMQPPPPDVIAQAKAAIARGADPAKVAERLRQNGFSSDGI